MKRTFCPAILGIMLVSASGCLAPQPENQFPSTAVIQEDNYNKDDEIAYLINSFDRPDIRLVLNNEDFTGQGAVRIMRSKYGHFREQIHSSEDFIRLCATNTSQSGSPMIVITKKGSHPVNVWLTGKLKLYRKHHS